MLETCDSSLGEHNEFKLRQVPNRGDEDILNRTIVVRDLPLNVNKDTLRNIMEKKANCKIEFLLTKVTGPQLSAHVTFEKIEAMEKFNNQWSIIYLKDFCRIAPATMKREELETRNRFTLKLAGLPFGITAYDLSEYLNGIRAKICYIPRTRERYARKRFALISFKTENDMNRATNSSSIPSIKNNRLFWLEPDTKTCHKCGKPGHIVRDCNEITDIHDRRQRLAQYSKVYTKFRTPNYRRVNRYRQTYKDKRLETDSAENINN